VLGVGAVSGLDAGRVFEVGVEVAGVVQDDCAAVLVEVDDPVVVELREVRLVESHVHSLALTR
jgi:hypothetical protein